MVLLGPVARDIVRPCAVGRQIGDGNNPKFVRAIILSGKTIKARYFAILWCGNDRINTSKGREREGRPIRQKVK